MLSKDEQDRLDEIERALRDDDPLFAANVDFDHLRRHQKLVAGAAFILGDRGVGRRRCGNASADGGRGDRQRGNGHRRRAAVPQSQQRQLSRLAGNHSLVTEPRKSLRCQPMSRTISRPNNVPRRRCSTAPVGLGSHARRGMRIAWSTGALNRHRADHATTPEGKASVASDPPSPHGPRAQFDRLKAKALA